MIRLHLLLFQQKMNAKLILQIHDEVWFVLFIILWLSSPIYHYLPY
jgi:hypothetical protein